MMKYIEYKSKEMIKLFQSNDNNESLENMDIYNSYINNTEDIGLDRKKPTLILDLDETLVYSSMVSCNPFKYDFIIETYVGQHVCLCFVYLRPFIYEFLDYVYQYFDLIVYTSSEQEYADMILDKILKNKPNIKRYYKQHTVDNMKSIDKVSLKEKPQVIILDNNKIIWNTQDKNNVLQVPSYNLKSKEKDTILYDIIPILDSLRFLKDVRSFLSLQQ